MVGVLCSNLSQIYINTWVLHGPEGCAVVSPNKYILMRTKSTGDPCALGMMLSQPDNQETNKHVD